MKYRKVFGILEVSSIQRRGEQEVLSVLDGSCNVASARVCRDLLEKMAN